MKDWTGNKNSVYKTIGASNHSESERDENDFYATDPSAINALLGYSGFTLPHNLWEPSCGYGHLSERLKKFGYNVYSTDIIRRDYNDDTFNFFDIQHLPKDNIEGIVTNPPYKFATDYVLHALHLLPTGGILALFMKTTFAEGQRRYAEIYSLNPPKYMLQCVERILCAKPNDLQYMIENKVGSAVSYAW